MKTLTDLIHLFQSTPDPEASIGTEPVVCPTCDARLTEQTCFRRFVVCDRCRHHFTISARRRIGLLADAGSFKQDRRRLVSNDPLTFSDDLPYRQRLDEARARTGLLDAVVTGECTIETHAVVVAVIDFAFMGGSMGSVVGEMITGAFERALARRLPLVIVSSSGGARMQEGMLSLVQMAKTSAAAQRLHQAGLLFLSILTNPTTGGVFASFASLGDITIAEPGALVGFAGPRVVEQTTGTALPPGSHTAEAQVDYGMIDQIVDRADLRDYLSNLLTLLGRRAKSTRSKRVEPIPRPDEPAASPWEIVRLARRPDRPTTLAYVQQMSSEWIELHGDRLCGDDTAIVCGLGKLDRQTVIIVGHERGADEHEQERRNGGRPRPEGFRKAQRVMDLASKFHLPVVTLIDTPGALLEHASESHGLARAIATTMAKMSDLPVPIVSAIIGEGGSGGALALGVSDRVLMLEHAIYSVIAPEGAAAILYRDAGRAQEISRALKLTAHDCKFLGVIDGIVPEPAGAAHTAPDEAAQLLKRALLHELSLLQGRAAAKLVAARQRKFRQMGRFETLPQLDISALRQRLLAWSDRSALQAPAQEPGECSA